MNEAFNKWERNLNKQVKEILPKEQRQIFHAVVMERFAQDKKWGVQNHSPIEWCAILGEEVGEVQKAALEYHFRKNHLHPEITALADYREELIQVAAVCFAMIESLDRNELA